RPGGRDRCKAAGERCCRRSELQVQAETRRAAIAAILAVTVDDADLAGAAVDAQRVLPAPVLCRHGDTVAPAVAEADVVKALAAQSAADFVVGEAGPADALAALADAEGEVLVAAGDTEG